LVMLSASHLSRTKIKRLFFFLTLCGKMYLGLLGYVKRVMYAVKSSKCD
jgi:hypothetical protein